jgi:leucyl/phenylalanyl-tRNA--protein transferase
VRSSGSLGLSVERLLQAYAVGLFPMADDRDARTVHWVEPRWRGVIPLDGFHVPRSLRKALRRRRVELRVDHDFAAVVQACAEPAPDRPDTWINDELIQAYVELHRVGHAHSVEAWIDGTLAGGLYGVRLGGAFFGESMFSKVRDASKFALVELVGRLRAGGFVLLDAQFLTEHLQRFGAIEISRADYLVRLGSALRAPARLPVQPYPFWPSVIGDGIGTGTGGNGSAQSMTHTS